MARRRRLEETIATVLCTIVSILALCAGHVDVGIYFLVAIIIIDIEGPLGGRDG